MWKHTSLFVVFLLLFLISCRAQVPGCTDPLANNYDPSATVNDGSCTYNAISVSPKTTSQLSSRIAETSGLTWWDGYLWTHNDNDDVVLYGLDRNTADIVSEISINGVENTDWEEISQDGKYLYIGDFGNNSSGNREDLHILRVEKSSLKAGDPSVDSICFSYFDQTHFEPSEPNSTDFDCEAMIVAADSLYLFTKQWINTGTSVYSLPKTPGVHVAVKTKEYDIQGLITGAAYLADERLVVLSGYTSLLSPFFWLLYDFTGHRFFSGNKRRVTVSLPFHQIEGITTQDGLLYYATNENFSFQPVANSPQKLHLFDLNGLLSDYIGQNSNLSNEPSVSLAVYPNPAENILRVEVFHQSGKLPFQIIDQTGRVAISGALSDMVNSVDIGRLDTGLYTFWIGQFKRNSATFIKH